MLSTRDAQLVGRIRELYAPGVRSSSARLRRTWVPGRRRALWAQAGVPAVAAAAAASLVLWAGSGERAAGVSLEAPTVQVDRSASPAARVLAEDAADLAGAADAGIWEEGVLFSDAAVMAPAEGENLPPEYRAIVAVFFED